MKRRDRTGLVQYDVEAEGLTGLTTLFTSFRVHVREGTGHLAAVKAAKRCLDKTDAAVIVDFDGRTACVTFRDEPGYLTIKKTPNGPRP